MKITIDTKEDSPEEIRKVILLLQQLSNESVKTNASSVFENPSPDIGSLMCMFDANKTEQEEVKKEEVESTPKIELF